jgi:hypothetical protein
MLNFDELVLLVNIDRNWFIESTPASRPPTEQKIPGSNPAGYEVFRSSLYTAVLLSKLNMHFHCVYLRKINT